MKLCFINGLKIKVFDMCRLSFKDPFISSVNLHMGKIVCNSVTLIVC